MNKKLYIKTIGCQMNVRDSEHLIAELVNKKNYQVCDDYTDADLIIINTCSVREKPVQRLFSEIGTINKNKKSSAKIGVCGCTASHLGEEIIKRSPSVDFVLGARNVSKISEIIDIKGAVEIDITNDESNYEFSQYRNNLFTSYINISIGCDKQCTFCIVPTTRGEEISVPPDMIINEIKKSVANGVSQIYLLGQNVNNYGNKFSTNQEKIDFSDLLNKISKINGLENIRFTSPHPLHMDDKFLNEFSSNDKICKSIHMPLQSGSNSILRLMKRGYTKEWFLNRIKKLKELCPDVTITTDIIVGFPTESKKDFEETLDVVKSVGFTQIFNFIYSPREGTKAIDIADGVEKKEANERLDKLIKLQQKLQDKNYKKEIESIHDVLYDELKPNGKIAGRSDRGFLVFAEGSEESIGKILKTKIYSANLTSLDGTIL
jgi:tRNA-2-methylthio-N6-dimethylallyladenosine synthase